MTVKNEEDDENEETIAWDEDGQQEALMNALIPKKEGGGYAS